MISFKSSNFHLNRARVIAAISKESATFLAAALKSLGRVKTRHKRGHNGFGWKIRFFVKPAYWATLHLGFRGNVWALHTHAAIW